MCTVDSTHACSDALLKLQPGDSIVYHVGLLARDRDVNFCTGAERFLAGAVDRLASLVMAQAARGGLLLYQRRLGDGAFEYHCYRPASHHAQNARS
jgi:hypothetical protein